MNIQSIKNYISKNERHLSFGALLLGFFVDNLTLTRIDLLFDNIILFSYLFIATISIILINRFEEKKFTRWLPYLMQYAFGGLFSGYIIFYSQSATLAGSWLFILILIALFLGNEFFKKRYHRTTFQISILFTAIFSFSIFFIPVVLGKMGAFIFILSGFVSLLLIRFIVYLIDFFSTKDFKQKIKGLTASIAGIYLIFNILYFTNLIPPIPLSLKEIAIYYNVQRADNGDFIVSFQSRPWYEFYKKNEFEYVQGSSLYSYSAVFAPTRITENISHQWSYFDKERGIWIKVSRIHFPISGGRDGGYRGYTFKTTLTPGRWRVDVLTERNQLLGRKKFTIVSTTIPPNVEIEVIK